MSRALPHEPASGASAYSFTTGVLVGQGSVILLIALFVRFVVFHDGSDEAPGKAIDQRRRRLSARLASGQPPAPSTDDILSKTNYDQSTHPAESTDWLNVLFAQAIAGYRSSLLAHNGEEGARQIVEEWLNPGEGVPWLDPIVVTSISLGSSYPLFSNSRIRPSDSSGRLRAETELDYSDSVTLCISTSLIINFPMPRFAVLPISLGVTIAAFSGTITTELLPISSQPTTATSHSPPAAPRQALQLSLQPDFALSITTTSLLGSRAKLQDLPKIEQLVSGRLRQAIAERIVTPRFFAVGLPALGVGTRAKAKTEAAETAEGEERVDGETEDEFVFVSKSEAALGAAAAKFAAQGRQRRQQQDVLGGGGFGDKLMREVIPPPQQQVSSSGEGGGNGRVLGMLEGEGLGMRDVRRRSSTAGVSTGGEPTPTKAGGTGAAPYASARMTMVTTTPTITATGLGGGVRQMPGGSDWGDGTGM